MVKLTQDLLVDAGGWQVLKEARAIHAAGRVHDASYGPPLLQGFVRSGEIEYRSGLRIESATNIENLCTCPDATRRGIVCAHSIAVALQIMQPNVAPPAPGSPTPSAPARPSSVLSPSSAEPEMQLHLILPVKFAAAWEKNSLQLVIEAESGSVRKPLAAWQHKAPWRGDFADVRLAEILLPLMGGTPASVLVLNREQMAQVLSALPGHPRVTFGKGEEAVIHEDGLRPALRVSMNPEASMTLTSLLSEPLLLSKAMVWRLDHHAFQPVATGLPAAYFSIFQSPATIPAAALPAFLRKEWPMLSSFFECEGTLPEIPAEPPPPPPPPVKISIEGSLNSLRAEGSPQAGERLQRHGFTESKGGWVLQGERQILGFFATALPQLQQEWQVTIGPRFEHVTSEIDRLTPRMEIRSSGEQWFDLSYDLTSSKGEKFSAADIARLLESGQSHHKRGNGRITVFDPKLLDDFSALLQDSHPEQRAPGIYRMDRRQAGPLASFAEDSGLKVAGDQAWRQWACNPRKVERLEPVPLGSLATVLRPYQQHGVAWLHFLAQNQFSGVLADEMGLGKTLQALAFLRTLSGQGPSLIVCPSSLIFNWQAEAARWTPELRVVALEGPQRSRNFDHIATADIVITSYPLLRLDLEKHRAHTYAAIILDEAQNIKNPDSLNAQSACALVGKHRLALTGTPVENSPRDLWSLFQFLMPGYLGTRQEFKQRYETSSPGGQERSRLRRRIAPFLLRRTKQLVAADLPEKLEQIAWCELTASQQEIYTQLTQTTRRQLSELASAKDQKKSRMLMLTALLRLRQAACDVRLLGMEHPPPDEEASAKLDRLLELLEEATEEGHRVLVFSQFVTMLGHIRTRLEAAGITYCYLDGSSQDRAQQVQNFQNGQAPVFLISLKAGGTGLNLTAADTVIHFDPWWNPAVEAQATDRAHRIGQRNIVTSYKLIARGTVEEKILALQNKKRAMIAATLESEQPMMEGLTLQEIESLLT